MVIKNRDGSVYKLQKPNQIMVNQTLWDDKEKVSVLNFVGEELAVDNIVNSPPVVNDLKLFEEPPAPPPEIKVVVETKPKPKLEPEVVKAMDRLAAIKRNAYCMPAFEKEVVDELYGETKKTVIYGDKFVFELIVAKDGDLSCELWTDAKISKQSVIMIHGERRWWKVIDIQDKLLLCYPSTLTPSFEA